MGVGDECIYEGRPRQFRRTREHGRLASGVGRWDKAEISASTSPRSVDTGTADARFPIVLHSDCAPPTLVRSSSSSISRLAACRSRRPTSLSPERASSHCMSHNSMCPIVPTHFASYCEHAYATHRRPYPQSTMVTNSSICRPHTLGTLPPHAYRRS